MEKKFDERGGLAVPKMTVMPPTVVNVDGPSVNVVSEGSDTPEWVKEYIGEKPIPDLDCGIYTEFEAEPEYQNQKPVSRDLEDELNIAPKE